MNTSLKILTLYFPCSPICDMVVIKDLLKRDTDDMLKYLQDHYYLTDIDGGLGYEYSIPITPKAFIDNICNHVVRAKFLKSYDEWISKYGKEKVDLIIHENEDDILKGIVDTIKLIIGNGILVAYYMHKSTNFFTNLLRDTIQKEFHIEDEHICGNRVILEVHKKEG